MIKISLVLVYLVIAAGAIVRMTGSGMGCPDWPKCFGHLVPPTAVEELQWHPNTAFKKGQVIILDETLQVAEKDFVSGETLDMSNWEHYTKHDYAKFNVWHTWIEYINRLCGALSGLAIFLMAIYSFKFWREKKRYVLLSWLVVFAMGFQAWLGATVVYSVLLPIKITLHMAVALIIVALLLYLLFLADPKKGAKYDRSTMLLCWAVLACTLLQVVLGTQVRQFVDHQVGVMGEEASQSWLSQPNIAFYVHRSFSILVLLLNILLFMRIKKLRLGLPQIRWVLGLIGIEIIGGMAMYYVDFPFGTQAMHLVLASVLFGIQFHLAMQASNRHKTAESL